MSKRKAIEEDAPVVFDVSNNESKSNIVGGDKEASANNSNGSINNNSEAPIKEENRKKKFASPKKQESETKKKKRAQPKGSLPASSPFPPSASASNATAANEDEEQERRSFEVTFSEAEIQQAASSLKQRLQAIMEQEDASYPGKDKNYRNFKYASFMPGHLKQTIPEEAGVFRKMIFDSLEKIVGNCARSRDESSPTTKANFGTMKEFKDTQELLANTLYAIERFAIWQQNSISKIDFIFCVFFVFDSLVPLPSSPPPPPPPPPP